MLSAADAAALTVLTVVVILVVAWLSRSRKDRFGGGPYNINLYDSPHSYPFYAGREALEWDYPGRCAAYCSQPPCVPWCR